MHYIRFKILHDGEQTVCIFKDIFIIYFFKLSFFFLGNKMPRFPSIKWTHVEIYK